jgi:diacylglycerol kinase family enzyme
MRAMLVVNPKATATTERQRDILTRALGSDLKVDLAQTTHRGHAIEYGRQAREQGLDVVVVLGGDGTINEVVNGLLGSEPWTGPDPAIPALAVVPGGSTNVFSRALGVARDPVVATSELLDALRAWRTRSIGLGRIDERWFTFTAGLGIDADAVRRVEKARAKGRRATPSLYTRCTVRAVFAMDRRRGHGPLTLEVPGEEPEPGLFMGIVANTSPWTYFRSKPIVLTQDVTFDTGLDLVAMRRMGLMSTLWAASGMLTEHGIRGRHTRILRDVPEFRLTAEHPVHLQVDGDYLGECTGATFSCVPGALRVIA